MTQTGVPTSTTQPTAAVERAQRALADGGYASLDDFMSKIAGQFTSLGNARKR